MAVFNVVINLSRTCEWAIVLSTLKSNMHLITSTFIYNRNVIHSMSKKTHDISLTESQNTVQLSGLQVRLNSMLCELTGLLIIFYKLIIINFIFL